MLLDQSNVTPLIEWAGQPLQVSKWPVYVEFDNSILNRENVLNSTGASVVPRSAGLPGKIRRKIRSVTAPDKITRTNINIFLDELFAECHDHTKPYVLIVGGGEVGIGTDRLYEDPNVAVISFDIYASPHVHFIADAHQIPLRDGCVDGVVVQAVLEHVLDPARVVAEIHRVLRTGGIVYAETPFLQHVHEGPYDFTRFTESGHRWLFRSFERIASGPIGGPGVQAVWTFSALLGGVLRSRLVTRVARLLFFWLRYLDHAIPESYCSDGAAGVYLLGRRSDAPIAPSQMPMEYRGAQ